MRFCRNYRETLEYFSYIFVFGPEFPAGDNMTLDQALYVLRRGVQDYQANVTDQETRTHLERCWADLNQAETLYRAGDSLEGGKHMQYAREWFRKAKPRT